MSGTKSRNNSKIKTNRLNPSTWLKSTIILTIFTAFIAGPVLPVGPLSIRLSDISVLLLFFSILCNIYYKEKIEIPNRGIVLASISIYIVLAVYFPVVGFIIYGYPVGYIVGDFRWIQVTLLGLAVAMYDCPSRFQLDYLLIALKLLIGVNLLFILLQYIHSSGLFIPSIVDLWYPNGIRNSYHINRYSGASSQISTLGLISSMGIVLFGYLYLWYGVNLLYFLLSGFLLISSGVRTSIVTGMTIFFVVLFINEYVSTVNIKKYLFGVVTFPPVTALLLYLDIGRIRTQPERYTEVIQFVIGNASWQEVSGRENTWITSLEVVSDEYVLGTLANPSWVLTDFSSITTIDSAYLLIYLQGGWLLLGAYIVLLCSIGIYSIRLTLKNSLGIIPFGFFMIILIHSFTQNLVTGIPGKTTILLTSVYCFKISVD